MDATLDAVLETYRLKSLDRAGWVRKGIPAPESVASHSWGLSWLVLLLCPPTLDRGRALAYAVLHDVPEVRVGDLTPADPVSKDEKARREHEAMTGLAMALSAPHLRALFEAYERQADAEARFVRELDRLDMAIQALVLHEAGHAGLAEFLDSAERVITTPALRTWMTAVRTRFGRPSGR